MNVDEKKICTIMCSCGLSNRIKTMMNAVSLYEKIYTEVEADSYIFPSIELAEESINPIIDWRLKVLPEEEEYIDEYKSIDMMYEKTPQYFIDKYLNCVDKLTINPDILAYIDDFISDWGDDVLGVHIRTWYSDGPRSLWHSNSIFEEEIEKFPNDKKIFLCSDNPETIKYFSKKYKERIITHPQKLHDSVLGQINPYDQYQNDIQLIADGFIDCLLLSKCDTIIGTWFSTFTEVAWWFGRCKPKIIIPNPLNVSSKEMDDMLFVYK